MRTGIKTPLGICLIAVLLVAATSREATAQDKDEASAKTKLAAQRLKLMRGLLDAWTIRVKDETDNAPNFAKEPVMRYSDPARGHLDGTVWRLGEKGRPRAFITMELEQPEGANGRDRITYEFLALSGLPFTISGLAVAWQPQDSALTFRKIPDAQRPATSQQRRLLQMKQLSRRFTAEETVGKEKVVLRLVPRPFDRYKPNNADDADAAVFVFSHGVNPEALLFLETDGKDWSYALGRLAGGIVTVKLDNEQVWNPGPRIRQWTANYMANRHYVERPSRD